MRKVVQIRGSTQLPISHHMEDPTARILEYTDALLRNRKLKYKLQVVQKLLLILTWTLVLFRYFIEDPQAKDNLSNLMSSDTLGAFSSAAVEDHMTCYSTASSIYADVFHTDRSKHKGIYYNWAREKGGKRYVRERGMCKGSFSYNDKIGNELSVNREPWDTRPEICERELENFTIPAGASVSVVIPFHNEQLSTLLRTLMSVLSKSNPGLLKDIIIVDDKSTDDLTCLQEELEKAIFTLDKVFLVRTMAREGSTKARIIGASYARGDILSYLDSHVEVNRKWLEPIVNRIHQNPKTVVMSILDTISDEDFSIKGTFIGYHGGFNWNLEFYWKDIPEEIKEKRTTKSQPITSPIMPAGAFALKRSYFMYLGLLDPDMKIWGVDDVEFSFRVWQCGGRVEILPCSRVGHIFRKRIPYSFQDKPSNVIFHNSVRTAEVVLEDYKKFYYAQANTGEALINTTSLVERKNLKKKLKCKSFNWFMKHVIPEMPLPDHDVTHYEFMKNEGNDKKCLEIDEDEKFTLKQCVTLRKSQFFSLNKRGLLKHYGTIKCVDVLGTRLILKQCESASVWQYTPENTKTVLLQKESKPDMLCLSAGGQGNVSLDKCEKSNNQQKWTFTYRFDWSKRLSYI